MLIKEIIREIIRRTLLPLSYRSFWVFPIKKNRVVFSSYYGNLYNDSPKAISDYLSCKCKETFDIIWLYKGKMPVDDYTKNIKFVKKHSIKALYYQATGKFWIDNCRKAKWITKRKSQFYVQTWHGGIGLKKCEKDAEDLLSKGYVKGAIHDSTMINLMTSGSKFNTNLIKRAFWYDGMVSEIGTPRADIFFQNSNKFRETVCNYFGIEREARLLLYAPTFRRNHNMDCYNIKYNELIEHLENVRNGKWKILIRLHPNMMQNQHMIEYTNNIINASTYDEISHLIISSDIVVTDYSSCMFDALMANKKVVLFAQDIDMYNRERGFYFDFQELPFPLATTNEELLYQIESYSENYKERYKDFNKRICSYETGNATEKISNIIRRLV